MEKYIFLILLALITIINSVEFCDLTVSANEPKECNKLIKASATTNYCLHIQGKMEGNRLSWKLHGFNTCEI